MRHRLPTFRGSVRMRTTLAATVVVALALSLGAWVLLVSLEASLVRRDDEGARSRVGDLTVLAEAGALPVELAPPGEDRLVQVVDDAGVVVASSPDARGKPPVATFRPDAGATVVRTVEDVPDDGDREDFRVWGARAGTPEGPVTVYVATSLESVTESVDTLRRFLLLGLPLLLLALAAGTWVAVGRALRPVEAIRSQVADITGTALDRRVPEPETEDEVGQLARTMNAMLDRLEAANVRQRTFLADASHELQSPLASQRTRLEVALSQPDRVEWPGLARELLVDGRTMEHLVRDLLFLAREDDTHTSVPDTSHPVDLDDVVLEEVARLRGGTRIDLTASAVSAAPVGGSREELVRLVRNLLENAEHHAETAVVVELGTHDGVVELAVTDDGPGVPPGDRERVFDRFVRLDPSRARDDGGTGLGLSIVAAIARRHGGSVGVEDRVGADQAAGARFVVRLPEAGTAVGVTVEGKLTRG